MMTPLKYDEALSFRALYERRMFLKFILYFLQENSEDGLVNEKHYHSCFCIWGYAQGLLSICFINPESQQPKRSKCTDKGQTQGVPNFDDIMLCDRFFFFL